MHQQLWGYKVEEKLYVGVREHKKLNTAGRQRLARSAAPNTSSWRAGGRDTNITTWQNSTHVLRHQTTMVKLYGRWQ
jgi:hypothetical protein